MDLHGPDIDAQGAAFPGVSPYVLLGRGQDFAWSATSAGQDIIDTFAEKLCEPDGSAPDVQSTHYLYKGQCRAMEILTRVNNITPNPGDPSPPETYTLEAQRTVHGIVYKRGTVDGQPVAFARQRSTYFHEADSARAFADLNRPVAGAERRGLPAGRCTRSTSPSTGSTPTTATSRYFNSGDNPVRAAGADPDLPNWGTGEYDWQGWETTFKTSDVTPFDEHPQVINQDYITSWNNKQAPGYDSADDQWGYGPHYRSQSLDEQIDQRLAGAGKMSLPELIDSMEVAGTVDLRGTQVLPLLLQVVGTPSDPQQAARGQHAAGLGRLGRPPRSTATRTASTTTPNAVQIMDAWWPRLLEAEFKPEMGTAFFDAVHGVLALRQRAQQPRRPPRQRLPGRLVGLRLEGPAPRARAARLRRLLAHVLRQRLADRLPRRAAPGALRRARRAGDARSTTRTRHGRRAARGHRAPPARATSGASTPSASARSAPSPCRTIHWINRPTFQQAVEIQGHRPRGYARPQGATPAAGPARAGLPGLQRARTASTARRSRSAPATRPSSARTTSRSARPTRTATRRNSVGHVKLRACSPATRRRPPTRPT